MHGGIFDIDVRLCGGFRAAVEALRAIDKIDGDQWQSSFSSSTLTA